MLSVAKPISQIQFAPGSAATISDVSWSEFEAILQEMGEHRSARLAYSNNTLEIMVPLPEHEKPKEILSDIVKILLKAQGKNYEPFGSTTFKREGIGGIEPDASFYIQNASVMVGRRRFFPNDPPPDLALECDVTSKTTIEAYEAIAVPEVWIYDNGSLTIHILREGQYIASDRSNIFPEIPLTGLIPKVIEQAWQQGTVAALTKFENDIQTQ